MEFRAGIEITAPTSLVFDTYCDVERWPELTQSVTTVKLLGDGPLRVGLRVSIKQPRLPRAVWEVTELIADRSFTWVARYPGVTTTATHAVEDLGDGRSRVTATLDQSGPLGQLVGLSSRRLTMRYMTMELQGLKQRCES